MNWSLVKRLKINVLFNNLYKIYKKFIAPSWIKSLKQFLLINYIRCQWQWYSFKLKRVYFVIPKFFFFVLWNVLTLIKTLFNIWATHVACKILEKNIYDCFSNSWPSKIMSDISSRSVQDFDEIDLKQICLMRYVEWFLRISSILRNTKSAFCFNSLIDIKI